MASTSAAEDQLVEEVQHLQSIVKSREAALVQSQEQLQRHSFLLAQKDTELARLHFHVNQAVSTRSWQWNSLPHQMTQMPHQMTQMQQTIHHLERQVAHLSQELHHTQKKSRWQRDKMVARIETLEKETSFILASREDVLASFQRTIQELNVVRENQAASLSKMERTFEDVLQIVISSPLHAPHPGNQSSVQALHGLTDELLPDDQDDSGLQTTEGSPQLKLSHCPTDTVSDLLIT